MPIRGQNILSKILNAFVAYHNDIQTLNFLNNAILFALGADLLIVSAARLFSYNINWPIHAIALAVGAFCASYLSKSASNISLRNSLVFGGSLVAFTLLSANLWDTSWDGTNYHLPSIIELSNGWNPLEEPSLVEPANLVAHGIYVLQWCIYALTGSYEAGKIAHAALILIALGTLLELLHYTTPQPLRWLSVLVAYLIVFNPVVSAQLFTFYVDGPIYLLSLTLLLQLFSLEYRSAMIHYAGIFVIIILLVNAKLTGAYYFAIIILLYLIYALIKRIPVKKVILAGLVGGVIGIGLVGYHPYVMRSLEAGTPFFLPYDKVIDYQLPRNFEGLSPPEKLAYSVFAKTDNVRQREAELKPPPWVSKSEIYYMGSPDVRLGGFGPFFALQLLLIYGGTIILVTRRKSRHECRAPLLVIACSLLLISACFPEPWWARYAPLLWASPLFCALAWPIESYSKHRVQLLLIAGVVLACMNTGLALAGNLARTVKGNIEFYEVIDTARSSNAPLQIGTGTKSWFHITLTQRFESEGIKARVVDKIECQSAIYYFHRVIPICQ